MINNFRHIVLIIAVLLLIGACTPTSDTVDYQIVHIGGIEDGDCLAPSVNLWDKPGGLSAGARGVGSLEGCVGLPVHLVDTQVIDGDTFHHVKTYGTTSGKEGWLAESLVIITN